MSFASAAAAPATRWSILVTIEGLGDPTNGLWRFCTSVPAYAGAAYRAWLTAFPAIASETLDLLGGVATAGELAVSILDVGDAITALLRTDAPSTTELSASCSSTDGTVQVDSAAGLSPNTFLYVGSEAMLITSIVGTTIHVTRGQLGTDPRPHGLGDTVWSALPYLHGRRMQLYVVPSDGTSADEVLFGSYILDRDDLADDLCTWVFGGKSQQGALGRTIASKTRAYRLLSVSGDPQLPRLELVRIDGYSTLGAVSDDLWPSSDAWLRVGDEVLRGTWSWSSSGNDVLLVTRRSCLGTVQDDLKPRTAAYPILVADVEDAMGTFRYSPGPSPSTSRSSGTWIQSDHPADLMLALLLSSGSSSDGLALTNYLTTGPDVVRGNWSSLPAGYGAGIPVNQVDVASFVAFRQRFPSLRWQNFVFGASAMQLAKLLADEFLRPLGAHLTTVGGLITLIFPRLPSVGDAIATVDLSAILEDEHVDRAEGAPAIAPGVSYRRNYEHLISAITYQLTDPDGVEHDLTVEDSDVLAGQRADQKPLAIPARSLRVDANGMGGGVFQLAGGRLRRFRAPLADVAFATDVSYYAVQVGQILALSHPDLPNSSTGRRGWTSVPLQVTGRTLVPDDVRGLIIVWHLLGYGAPIRTGRIAPAAAVASVVGAVATVTTNRYAKADAAGELPNKDAAGFQPGDVVALARRDGTRAAGGTQKILGIVGDAVTLNGTFSGTLAPGLVLIYADRSAAEPVQYTAKVYWADRTSRQVGASGDAPWRYAEA